MMDERELEAKLRAALRPVAAPDGLAERIVRRAEARAAKTRRPMTQQIWLRWGALAAVLTMGTFGGLKWNEKRQAEEILARQAAEQFTQAMTIATRKISRVQKNLIVEIPLSVHDRGQ
jgi:hypothetical protein